MFYGAVKTIVKTYMKSRYKIKVIGEDRIPRSGPVVICSNHKSDFDPPLLGIATNRELSFFAKKELFEVPILGPIISRLNAFPVDRGKGDRAALKKAVEVLEEGNMLVIFPEGRRNQTEELQPFQEGASFMAVKSKAKIVPTAIKGNYNRKEGITLVFGKPIDVSKLIQDGKNRKEITHILYNEIYQLLNGVPKLNE